MTAPVPRQSAAARLLLIGDALEFSKTTQLGLGDPRGVLHPCQGVVLQGDASWILRSQKLLRSGCKIGNKKTLKSGGKWDWDG